MTTLLDNKPLMNKILNDIENFKAINLQEPTIIIGKSYTDIQKMQLSKEYSLNLFGCKSKIGNFDTGYKLI